MTSLSAGQRLRRPGVFNFEVENKRQGQSQSSQLLIPFQISPGKDRNSRKVPKAVFPAESVQLFAATNPR